MGAAGAWEYDAWWGWAFLDQYPGELKAVIRTLQEHPPVEDRWARIRDEMQAIRALVVELTEVVRQ